MPYDGTAGSEDYALLISAGTLQFITQISPGTTITVSTPFTSTGSWHHVVGEKGEQLLVGLYDGAYMTIYVDGVEKASAAQTGNLLGNLNGNMRIGSYSPSFTQYFSGSINDVRIYKEVLSARTIAEMYETGLSSCAY